MKPKVYMLIVALLMVVCIPVVNASSYYTNDLGVEFTEKQYNYVTDLFYDGYQKNMPQDEFDHILNSNLFDKPITAVEINEPIFTNIGNGAKSDNVYQNGRTTKIVKSCTTTECLVTLTATWSLVPTVNSYDVIGFRPTSATITTIGTAKVTGNGYAVSYPSSSAQQSGTGFGHSVLLGGVTNMKASTYMYCTPSGTVYGSYQHAMSSISIANSKKYTIGAGGYGYVFNFYGASVGKYDNATGVYLSL